MKKKRPTIKQIKAYWDGPKVGFNEELYDKYIQEKKDWRAKMN